MALSPSDQAVSTAALPSGFVSDVAAIERIAAFGRILFAGGIAAFGVQHFLFGDFVPGRAPVWPEGVPGKLVFAWITGAILMASGVALLVERYVRWAALAAGTLVLVWALGRLVPLVASDAFIGGNWTRAGKAIVILGGLCALTAREIPARRGLLILCGRIALGGFMILAGFQHYRWDEFVFTLVPTWVPGGAAFWTYASGVLLILGGAGMIVPRTAALASGLSGLMILLWVPMLHIPRALAAAANADSSRNEWIAVVEATAFAGLALYLAGAVHSCRRSLIAKGT
jgi:uncharacterized membrane protein